MRVGIVGLQHESNTFLPRLTELEDFQAHGLLRGAELIERYRDSHHEVGGFLAGLKEARIEAVGVFMTQAVPSGVIMRSTADALIAELTKALDKTGDLDGILVAPHGAAVAEGHSDFDGDWLSILRNKVGSQMPIICTLDAHANISQSMISACNATICYRTNPHLDQEVRGHEAASLVARTLRGEIQPTQAVTLPPMVINIERQHTSEPHCRLIYDAADAMLASTDVLSNSIILGFPYADVEKMGSGVIVVTDGNMSAAKRLADELALKMWEQRQMFAGELISVSEALDRAAQFHGTTCLLDMGDNVGGGSPADGTLLAHAVCQRHLLPAFVCLYDPEAVTQAYAAGVGQTLSLAMGGKTDPQHGSPLCAHITVRSLHDGKFVETRARHGAAPVYEMGPTAIVETDNTLTVMLTSRRTPPFSLVQLSSCELKPEAFRVLIAKGVHAPVAAYAEACEQMIRVNTPGTTTADLTQLCFKHRHRPLFPFENIAWLPTDGT